MALIRCGIRPPIARVQLAKLTRLLPLVGAAALSVAACSSAPAQSTLTAQATPAGSQAPRTGAVSSAQAPAPADAASCKGLRGETVSSAAALRTALATARPGTTILLAAGTYTDKFTANTSGTAAHPITLCGSRSAVLDGGSIHSGYTLHLDHANWWRIEGFTVTGGQKGVVTDHSDHDLITGLLVHGIGDEAIHLREDSSYDTVSRNLIRDTGRYKSFYGEGIYVGTANKNWCRYTGCQPDASDHNTITGNNIAHTTAENIDIKEGTTGGIISGNYFNGTGMDPSAATSWVNVKGNGWKITGNTGIDSVRDGLSDHQVYAGWGMNNVFAGNKLTVNSPGYGIFIQGKRLHDTVYCNNKVSSAGKGYSNQTCTPA